MKENVITTTYTCVARRVTYVEQELLTLLGHLGSPAVFSGVLVNRGDCMDRCDCIY